jgi:hypothetical protein
LAKKVAKLRNNTLVVELIFIKTKWTVFYRRKEINMGDTILIKGMTTGEQQLVITEMQVNDVKADKAVAGCMYFSLTFRIRLSDKLYKI